LVDDEETLRWALQEALTDEGYDVDDTNDSIEALKMARQANYDLIMSDLSMPTMNGLQLISEIRKEHPEIKAIIITGYGTTEAVIEAMRQGISDFVMKPFKIDQIKNVIYKVVNQPGNSAERFRIPELYCEEREEDYVPTYKQTKEYAVAEDKTETTHNAFYDITETQNWEFFLFGGFSREFNTRHLDVIVKTAFRYNAKPGQSASFLIKGINRYLCENIAKRFPVALFCAAINKQKKNLYYSSYGQEISSFIWTPEEKITWLTSNHSYANMFSGMRVKESEVSVGTGSKIILIYNDALGEKLSRGILSTERIKEVISGITAKNAGTEEEIANSIKQGIAAFEELSFEERNSTVMVSGLWNNDHLVWTEEIAIALPIDNYASILQTFWEKLSNVVQDDCKRHDIITSVNEAVLNALAFAYKDNDNGEIVLKFLKSGEEFIAEVHDQGCGFDVQNCSFPDTTLYKGITKRKGRGIFIMKQLMDRVMIQSYKGIGTSVFMAKRVNGNGN